RTIRRLYERGLVSGVGGNASARVRTKDQILITPAGYFKGGVTQGDLVRVNLEGEVIRGGRPSSELPTHLAAYRAREDVNAVVHGHPPNAVGLASAGIEIPIMTPEHAVMIRRIEVVDFAVPGEDGARAIATELKRCNVVGIRNHGFFSMGRDLHEAASRLEVLEESSKIYLAGRAAGGAPGLDEEALKRTREAYGLE
ncbi:MAG: class II aldolase/adducin family protein, partial [Nitrososphaerota archaeon]|nr:class II aldolase/adducin family protein [Nitrososphaerota archaeon]